MIRPCESPFLRVQQNGFHFRTELECIVKFSSYKKAQRACHHILSKCTLQKNGLTRIFFNRPNLWKRSRMWILQKQLSCKMPKDNEWGIRQYAGCCLDLYLLQQSTDRGCYEEMKLFKRYVDDIICKDRGDLDEYSKSNINCHWYKKPTDTGQILNFCSCAPLQRKKNAIQGTVQRVFNATFNWLAFNQAFE